MNTWDPSNKELLNLYKYPNNIYVFGSNTEGRHGKGSASVAKRYFGAIYGNPKGFQGRSYAIITKNLSIGTRSIPIDEILNQIHEFYKFAKLNSDLNFYVDRIGCGLAGYQISEIAQLFYTLKDYYCNNVYLPKEFAI